MTGQSKSKLMLSGSTNPEMYSSSKNDSPSEISENESITVTSPETRKRRENLFEFQIVANSGKGECLFLSLAQFLSESQLTPEVCPFKVRQDIVDFITDTSSGEVPTKDGTKSVWSRYQMDIKVSLERFVPFFRNFESDPDEEVELQAKEEYRKYMSKHGTYGTYVELCAAMELFSFQTTLIEENHCCGSGRATKLFNVCHLEQIPSQNKPRAFFLFSGNMDYGHFELLQPKKPSMPLMVKGVHELVSKWYNHLVLVCRTSSTLSGTVANSKPSLSTKRPLSPRTNRSSKRTKPSTESSALNFESGSASESLNFQTSLPRVENSFLQNPIGSEFGFSVSKTETSISWPGVTISDTLKVGPFRMLFFHVSPRAVFPLYPQVTMRLISDSSASIVLKEVGQGERLGKAFSITQMELYQGRGYTVENGSCLPVVVMGTWTI